MRRPRVLILLLSLQSLPAHAAICTGAVSFESPTRYAAAADRALLVRDLNGDGAPDIITSGNNVDQSATFSLFLNRGDGTFDNERLIPAGLGERIEDSGDVDGDGIIDLLASSYWTNSIVVYRGAAAPFPSYVRTSYETATHGGPSRIVDYDRDGKPDLVSFSFGSGNLVRVHLFHGEGTGELAPKKTFETSLGNADSPSLRTINGALEILVAEHSGHVGLIHFASDSIVVSVLPAGPGLNLSSAFVDVNGDGVADIIDTNDQGIFITLGKPDGTFVERAQLMTPRRIELPLAVRDADMDGDGHTDLIVRDFGSSTLYYFRGLGSGLFDDGTTIDAGGAVNDLALADVNRDGRPDIVTANADGSVSVMINRGPCTPPRRHAVRR